jgi:hypothetical protein
MRRTEMWGVPDTWSGRDRIALSPLVGLFAEACRAARRRTSRSRGTLGPSASYVRALTVTVNDALAVLALESVAEHLTTVRPIGNRPPDRGTQVTGTLPSAASLAATE